MAASQGGLAPFIDGAFSPFPTTSTPTATDHPHPRSPSAGVVTVITNDGRHLVGTMRGYDQATNIILEECTERVYSEGAGVETIVLGLYVVRGDNIALIGEMDEDRDAQLDLTQIKAPPLKPVVH